MSLIHDALKKLEGAGHGYGKALPGPQPGRKKPSARPFSAILPVLIAAALLSAFLATRYYRTKKMTTGDAPAKAERADVDGRLGEEAAAGKEAVKPAEEAAPWSGHNAKGVEHYRAGRLKDAVAEFEKGASFKPDASARAALLNNAAVAHMSLGDAGKAERLLKEALRLRPDYAEAANNIGAVMQRRGRLHDAEAYFKKASALRPDYADALLNRASTLERLGLYGQALAEYDKYLAVEGDGEDSEKIARRAGRIRRGIISGAYAGGR